MKVAVVKESAPGERRVALVPETVQKLRQGGLEVLVEQGAGDGAWFPDDTYTAAGAADCQHRRPVRDGGRHPHGDPPRRGRACQAARRAGGDRHARAADRPAPGPLARGPRRHRDLARRAAAHAVAGPGHGRAELAGQRRRLQGGARRRRGLRPVLPAADHRGRHGAAGEAARARRRRGRAAGDRHRPAARRAGQRLRRAPRVQGRGRVARRDVHRADRSARRARAATPASSPPRSGTRSRPSWPRTSPGTT